jgi:predicted NAD-dependent protein-ADP-ribosyltransferase YbiA (DUF1768 family)
MKIIWCILWGVAVTACASMKNYPEHWWQAYPESERQIWEILPQAAQREKSEVILSKRNELGLLSNFAATPFEFRGKRYASLEGFWQMMKYPEGKSDPRFTPAVKWEFTREQVAQMVAFDAHAAGVKAEENMNKLGIDWISFEGEQLRFKSDPKHIDRHYELISGAIRAKAEQNPKVKEVLLATGDLKLRPNHFEDSDGTKSWQYYSIWMKIRESLSK